MMNMSADKSDASDARELPADLADIAVQLDIDFNVFDLPADWQPPDDDQIEAEVVQLLNEEADIDVPQPSISVASSMSGDIEEDAMVGLVPAVEILLVPDDPSDDEEVVMVSDDDNEDVIILSDDDEQQQHRVAHRVDAGSHYIWNRALEIERQRYYRCSRHQSYICPDCRVHVAEWRQFENDHRGCSCFSSMMTKEEACRRDRI